MARACTRHIGATRVRNAGSGMSWISNTTLAPSTIGLSRLSVIEIAGTPARHQFGKQPRRIRVIVAKADGDQRILGTGRMRLFVDAAADPVEQHHAPSELSQHIGQMRGDRKRAAEAQQIDVARLRQDRGRGIQLARMRRLAERDQRRLRLGDEASEHRRGLAAEDRFLLVLHARQPRLVARRHAGHEPRAKHLLHLGEAAKAQRMREADDRRGRHARALRDLGDGAERDLGRVVEHEFGDLLQAAGQRPMALGDRAAQLVVADGFVGGLVHRLSLPRSRRFAAWFKYSTLQVNNRMFILSLATRNYPDQQTVFGRKR